MVITERVKSQYFVDGSNEQSFIRIEQANVPVKPKRNGLPWSADEHDRFLSALEAYPSGPWKVIASFVGTRTTRQTMTHAQKYREKIARMKRTIKDHTAVVAMRPPVHRTGGYAPAALTEIRSPASPSTFPAPHQHQQQHVLALPSMHHLVGNTASFASTGAGVPPDLPLSTAVASGELGLKSAVALAYLEVDHGALHAFADMYEPIEIADDVWHQALVCRDSKEANGESVATIDVSEYNVCL